MVIKVSKALLKKERKIPIGFGVSLTFKAFKFAQYKEVESWARRQAREELSPEQKTALAGKELDELGDEFHDSLVGLAEQMLLDRLISEFCIGWDGIEVFEDDPDQSEPLPFTVTNWPMVRDTYPLLADTLRHKLADPMTVIAAEGNESALSLST